MKANRFILNTDYITPQNDREFEVSVTLPSTFTAPANTERHFKTTISVPGSASMSYRCYFTTTEHQYAAVGCTVCALKFGEDYIMVALSHDEDAFTLDIFNYEELEQRTYSGASQTITAHIQTFIDPFQV